MYDHVHIDFETRSQVDLKKVGSFVYAEHLSTEVLCLGYAFDDDPVKLWDPKTAENPPYDLIAHIEAGGKVIAHNLAGFEYPIWNLKLKDWGKLDINQCECTMAMSYAMALPGNLDGASKALGIGFEKDMKGHRIMLQLCKPRRITSDLYVEYYDYYDHHDKYQALFEYCKRDVEVERELYKRLLKLSDKEMKVWKLDAKINRNGVKVDKFCADRVKTIVTKEKDRLDESIKDASHGYIASCTAVIQIINYLKLRGIETDSIVKSEVEKLLESNIPDDCREVLELRREAAKSSTAKLDAMLNGLNLDGRMRGLFQYHGASTGRFAGRRVQLQNLPRPKLDQDKIEMFFKVISDKRVSDDRVLDLCEFYGLSFMDLAKDLIRGFIVSEDGYQYIACDYSAIEARVLAWLAGEEKKLEVFRGHGKIYEHAASQIYKVEIDEVTKDQRQIGKVAELALGYQGGKGAFKSMASVYGVEVNDERADSIKSAWREANPNIVNFWYGLERAAINAVVVPGKTVACGKVEFKVSGSFLFCKLPSGRVITYPYPKIKTFDTPWGEPKQGLVYKGVDSYTNKWCEIKTYGGKLCENVTQAVARDILVDALLRLDEANYRVVMHVHDEVVVEAPSGSVNSIESYMKVVPDWAEGLPIDVDSWMGKRFRK